jgi:hypothetical protein
MVQEKSFVLPLTATFQSDNDSVLSLAEKADLISGSRSNRPYFNDSWIDKDHYHQFADEPAELHIASKRKETYHNLDEVNGTVDSFQGYKVHEPNLRKNFKKPVEINQYEASVFDLSTMNHDVHHGRPRQSRTTSSMHLRS